tara:strand:+ start:5269 stop:5892 length:624 start_codon:yes stop_codon:yes gene_type:complete
LAAFLVLPGQTAQAQMAIGIKGGTAGVGGEFSKSITKKINARVSGTFFSYSANGVYEDEPDIAYDVSNNITSIGLVADYFPFTRGLKLSAGVFYHDFLIDGGATPTEAYTIEDKTFQPEKLGSLSGKMEYESKIVPYAGIGLGNPVARGSRLKLNLEIGAMYTNSPSFTMEGEGMIGPTANQDQGFEDGMKDFKFYPVLNLGLSFRF